MKIRIVPVIAAALTAMVAAGPVVASDSQSNSFLQAGAAPALDAMEPNDATLGTWIPGATLPTGVVRYAHAQCLGENIFYAISGVAPGGVITPANQRYNAATNTWTTLAPIPSPAEGPSGTCYQGRIYVAGGSAPNNNSFRIYDIAANTWTVGPPVPFPTAMAHVGAHNGRIYVAGGDGDFSPGTGVSNLVGIYDIATNTWLANGANMPTATSSGGFAQLGSFLYVVGGWGPTAPGSNVNQTMRYDMATNTWTVGPTFTSGRSDLVVAATNVALYAIGGDNNGGGFFDLSANVERLDITAWPAGTWTAADPLPSPRSGHKGGYCTRAFFPATGEVWSTGGIAAPFPTFSNTNQYLQAEACPSAASVAPVALEVDPAGNRVIEPNETAVSGALLAEHRRRGHRAAHRLRRRLHRPGGRDVHHQRQRGHLRHGRAGATASCTTTGNCYAVTVTAATRPIVHWDAHPHSRRVTPTATTKDVDPAHRRQLHRRAAASRFYRFIETLSTTASPAAARRPTTARRPPRRASRWRSSCSWRPRRPPATCRRACGATPMFNDVPASSPFCRWIEELARRGVVGGCGGGNYCPLAAGDPRADGGLRAPHARPDAQPAALRRADVRRRARVEPVLPLDRGAGAARRRHRLRRRQLLPDGHRSPASRWPSSCR